MKDDFVMLIPLGTPSTQLPLFGTLLHTSPISTSSPIHPLTKHPHLSNYTISYRNLDRPHKCRLTSLLPPRSDQVSPSVKMRRSFHAAEIIPYIILSRIGFRGVSKISTRCRIFSYRVPYRLETVHARYHMYHCVTICGLTSRWLLSL